MQESVEIFISYAHEDDRLRKKLGTHLAQLMQQGLITVWHDRDINAGSEWQSEINEHLNTAQIILLLISSDFMASDYCYSIELRRAIERHQMGDARVIPIILRPVSLQGAPFEKLKALPTDGHPVNKWRNQDDAWVDVVDGIRQTVQELRPRTLEDDSVWADLVQRSRRRTDGFFQDIQHFPGLLGSFIPELYVQRAEVEDILDRFLMSNTQALILVGDSGIGKTHLLCAWTKQLMQEGHTVFLYNCGPFLSPDVTSEIAHDLSISREEVPTYFDRISRVAERRGKQCVLIFDAINEFHSEGDVGPGILLKYINDLVGHLPNQHVHVIVSCIASTWRYLGASDDIPLSARRYFRPAANDFVLRLQNFTPEEFELAYKQYYDFFHLHTTSNMLSTTLRDVLHHPVMLRLLAEIYRDRDEVIIHEMSLLKIFQRLYEERVTGDRERFFIDELSAEMLRQCRGVLSIDDLMHHEQLGPYILDASSDSSYRRLQKKGIMTVVASNVDVGAMLKFTYDRLGGYILARHLLRKQISREHLISELIEDIQNFSLAWDTARALLVLWKDPALFSTFAQSMNIDLRQLIVQSLVDIHSEEPILATTTIKSLLQKDSQEAHQTALKAAYYLASGAQDIFLWAATKGTSVLRQTTKNILYLIWRSDPQFTYDLLLKLLKRLRLLSMSGRNALTFVLDLLTTIYINHCHQEEVIAALDKVFYTLARDGLHLHQLPLDKIVDYPIFEPIFKAISASFAEPTLNTVLLADLVPPEQFFNIPTKDRECLKRIAIFLDPCTDIRDAKDDLITMLQSNVMFFHTAVALVLAIHAYRNFSTAEPFLRELFKKAGGQGRLWMLFSFCIPMLDTPPEWLDIVEHFTDTLIEEHPAIFYKEEASALNWCDFALLPLGLVYGKRNSSILSIERRLQRTLKRSNQRLLERCIVGLGTAGFYFPQAVFRTLRTAIPQWSGAGLDNALVESLSLIRALHFDDVDIFLSQIGATETLRYRISARTDVELVGRQVYGMGLLHNAVHFSVFAPKMRKSFSMAGLRMLAEASKPEDFITAYSRAAVHFVYGTEFHVGKWFDPE